MPGEALTPLIATLVSEVGLAPLKGEEERHCLRCLRQEDVKDLIQLQQGRLRQPVINQEPLHGLAVPLPEKKLESFVRTKRFRCLKPCIRKIPHTFSLNIPINEKLGTHASAPLSTLSLPSIALILIR